jgi:hypothetical protein
MGSVVDEAGPAALIYICVRHTLEWRDEALVEAHLREEMRPKVEAWDATFDLPYREFRHRLKQIAQLNLGRVENAACASLEKIPPGALVVPADDDDWFSPNLANRLLEKYDPAFPLYGWMRRVISPSKRRRHRFQLKLRLKRRRKRFTCASNDYAVKNVPELAPLVSNHVRASEYFDAHPSQVRRFRETLGIQNRNMASQTALAWRRPSISRDELIASFHRYRDLYASWRLPRELRWARPYVDLMAELMQQIHVK